MSTLAFVPENTLVRWYFHPSQAETTPKPQVPFDHPVRTLRGSINLTMQFVTAANPIFGQGFQNKGVRTVAKPDGHLTLFWPLYEVTSEQKIETDETDTGIRTETVIRYYGFDAGRRLMVETVKSHKREDAYTNSYAWPHSMRIPRRDRAELRGALLDFRRDLSS